MSETNQTPSDEQIRKVYARDVKPGDTFHTVFKAEKPAKQTSRAGKTFLTMQLVDRTGRVDARVFEKVDETESAFRDGDFVLVKGRTIAFHGKPQLVIDALERLDPGPIDAKEFAAPPEAPKAEAEHDEKPAKGAGSQKQLRQRLHALLDEPQVAKALEVLVRHLESYIDERVAARLGGGSPANDEGRRGGRRGKGEGRPAVEVKGGEAKVAEPKPPPARDPNLPKELSFKPFNLLVGEPAKSTES